MTAELLLKPFPVLQTRGYLVPGLTSINPLKELQRLGGKRELPLYYGPRTLTQLLLTPSGTKVSRNTVRTVYHPQLIHHEVNRKEEVVT